MLKHIFFTGPNGSLIDPISDYPAAAYGTITYRGDTLIHTVIVEGVANTRHRKRQIAIKNTRQLTIKVMSFSEDDCTN